MKFYLVGPAYVTVQAVNRQKGYWHNHQTPEVLRQSPYHSSWQCEFEIQCTCRLILIETNTFYKRIIFTLLHYLLIAANGRIYFHISRTFLQLILWQLSINHDRCTCYCKVKVYDAFPYWIWRSCPLFAL